MKRLVCIILAGALLAAPAVAEPVRRAVFANQRLWVLVNGGKLWSLSEDSVAPTKEVGAGAVADLCVADGHATVLTQTAGRSSGWEIRQYSAGSWKVIASLHFDGAPSNAFGCGDKRVVAVFDYSQSRANMLAVIRDGNVQEGRLNGLIRQGQATHVLVHGNSAYVGTDAGEWGGGLQRVNLDNRLVESIDQLDTDNGCAGPLYFECDPVTGLSPLPGIPDCIALTTGLEHMSEEKGSVLSVCGRTVDRLYEQVSRVEPPSTALGQPGTLKVVFRDLAASSRYIYASSAGGVYRIDPSSRAAELLPMQHFKRIGAFTVGFGHPDFVAIESDSESDHSNSFLLLAPKDN